MNKAIVVGRIVYPPQFSENNYGGVLSMFVKSVHKYKDRNGVIQERAQTLRVSLWGKLAELYRTVSQGDLVTVEGRIQNKKVQKKDGSEEWQTEVVANGFEVLDSNGGDVVASEEQSYDLDEQDIPF